MPDRRVLTFESVAEAPAEAARLHASGYGRAGNWDLAQCCGHLADWLGFAVDGDTPVPTALRPVFWAVRKTVGPRALLKILEAGTMKPGVSTAPATVPAAATDPAAEAAGVDRLSREVERFLAHPGEYATSPIFGAITREQARRLHAIHCAHHLGFLVPRESAS